MDAPTIEQCKAATTELNDLRHLKESYWHIRDKANEYRDGDKNTAYFHHKVSFRIRQNQIIGLLDEENEWYTKPERLETIVTSYFQKLFQESQCVNVEEAVMDLIDFKRSCWDEDKVYQTFSDEDVARVFNQVRVLVGRLGAVDWWTENASDMEKKCWKLVWNLNIPPKLKHFVWRAWIPRGSGKTICQTHMGSQNCIICGAEAETIAHSLLSVCMQVRYGQQVLFQRVEPSTMVNFTSLVWAAWTCRNKALFEDEEPNSGKVAQGMVNFVEGWREYNVMLSTPQLARTHVGSARRWTCPQYGRLKVNVDAYMGSVRRYRAKWSVAVAEACAARFGVEVVVRFGFSKVALEGDSMIVARLVSGSLTGFTPVPLFLDDTISCSKMFLYFSCNDVQRG
ncbi:Mannan endo-1 4-beta-mannosidase man26A [Bienertia sinuspersici]